MCGCSSVRIISISRCSSLSSFLLRPCRKKKGDEERAREKETCERARPLQMQPSEEKSGGRESGGGESGARRRQRALYLY